MPSPKNGYAIFALALVIFIDSMGFGLIFPILGPLLMDPTHGMLGTGATAGGRELYFGLVLGIFSLFVFFSTPILGEVSDQMGRRKIILFCLFGTIITSLICAAGIELKSMAVLLIGRAAAGIFAGSQPIAQAAIADISSGTDRAKNLGLIGAAGSMGFVFGPIMGGYFSDSHIVSWFSYDVPFYLDAFFALLNAVLLFFTFRETYQLKRKLTINFMKGMQTFLQGFSRVSIRRLSAMLLLLELSFSLYFQFISLYLSGQFHFGSSRIGLFMSLSGVIFAITLGIIMRYVIRMASEIKIIIGGLLILISGFVLPFCIHTGWMQWFALFPIIMGCGIAYNPLIALFSNSVSVHEQGWVMGITSAVMSVSWILGAIGASGFYYLNPQLPYLMNALFVVLALMVAVQVARSKIMKG